MSAAAPRRAPDDLADDEAAAEGLGAGVWL